MQIGNNQRERDHYILPKYSSLKEEIINNEICSLPLWYWNNQYAKAEIHKQSIPYLKTKAYLKDYITSVKSIRNGIPSKRGYIDGDHMNLYHLIVVIIYCGTNVCCLYICEKYIDLIQYIQYIQ